MEISIVDISPSGKAYLISESDAKEDTEDENRSYLPRFLVVRETKTDVYSDSDIIDSGDDLEELRKKYPSSKVVRAKLNFT